MRVWPWQRMGGEGVSEGSWLRRGAEEDEGRCREGEGMGRLGEAEVEFVCGRTDGGRRGLE